MVAAGQTVHSGTASLTCRYRAAPLPAPRVRGLVPGLFVVVCTRAGNRGRRDLGGGRGFLTRACLGHLEPAGQSAPTCNRTSLRSAPRVAHNKHQQQQWCAGEGAGRRRWRVRVRSRGCAHVCKRRRTSGNVPCLHHRGGCNAPFTPPTPPTPGVRLTHFLFYPTPTTRMIALLPTP